MMSTTAFPLLPAFDPSHSSLRLHHPPSPSPSSSPASSSTSLIGEDHIFVPPPNSSSSITTACTTPRSSLDSLRPSPAHHHLPLPPQHNPRNNNNVPPRCPHAPLRRRSRRSSLADASHHYSPYPPLDKQHKRRSWCGPPTGTNTTLDPSPAKKLRRSPAVAALNVFTSLAFAESRDAAHDHHRKRNAAPPLGEAFQFAGARDDDDEEGEEVYRPLSSTVPFPGGRDPFNLDDLRSVSPLDARPPPPHHPRPPRRSAIRPSSPESSAPRRIAASGPLEPPLALRVRGRIVPAVGGGGGTAMTFSGRTRNGRIAGARRLFAEPEMA